MKNIISVVFTSNIRPAITKKALIDAAGLIIDSLCKELITEIGIVITNDETIRQLNKTYRNIDNETDVLSFQMHAFENNKISQKFIMPPDSIKHLGEVIISYETAKRQARENRISVKDEIIKLLLHGILHLSNYDHVTLKDTKVMANKEKQIMAKLNDRA